MQYYFRHYAISSKNNVAVTNQFCTPLVPHQKISERQQANLIWDSQEGFSKPDFGNFRSFPQNHQVCWDFYFCAFLDLNSNDKIIELEHHLNYKLFACSNVIFFLLIVFSRIGRISRIFGSFLPLKLWIITDFFAVA